MTPDISELTISCTTTAIAGSSLTPLDARYEITRSPYTDAQQSLILRSSSASPSTFVKVSFMPANDVSAVSSAVADERTATTGEPMSW